MENNFDLHIPNAGKPLVSVIISNFNNAMYLIQCIESVIIQGLDIVKEIIIIDDHSTDNSWNVLRTFKNSYPDLISIFKNPKKGVQSARNFGFSKSSGEYIQWLDSDDVLGKNKIRNQLNILLKEHNKSVAFCGWVHFTDDIKNAQLMQRDSWKNYFEPINWLIDSWLNNTMIQTACWLTSRYYCKENHWDERIVKNQDGIYFFNIIVKVEQLFFTENSIVYYRLPSSKNISRQKNHKALESVLNSYKSYHRILKIRDDELTRQALASNYTHLIAYVYPEFKDIQARAESEILSLGVKKLPKIGGWRFIMLQSLFGFKLALKLRNVLNSVKSFISKKS